MLYVVKRICYFFRIFLFPSTEDVYIERELLSCVCSYTGHEWMGFFVKKKVLKPLYRGRMFLDWKSCVNRLFCVVTEMDQLTSVG